MSIFSKIDSVRERKKTPLSLRIKRNVIDPWNIKKYLIHIYRWRKYFCVFGFNGQNVTLNLSNIQYHNRIEM